MSIDIHIAFYSGAVKWYYESWRRLFNDAKPSDLELKRHKKQKNCQKAYRKKVSTMVCFWEIMITTNWDGCQLNYYFTSLYFEHIYNGVFTTWQTLTVYMYIRILHMKFYLKLTILNWYLWPGMRKSTKWMQNTCSH